MPSPLRKEEKMFKLTETGKKHVNSFIRECKAKRKEILSARLDTVDETEIPTVDDILCDIAWWVPETEDVYANGWGITDHYDLPLTLKRGVDFVSEVGE